MLSIVIPVFNEGPGLDELIRRVLAATEMTGLPVELVFVNDGSTDDSATVIRRHMANEPRIRHVELSRNFGHQVAVTAGLDLSQGDAVVVMDADLQDPPELIPDMVEAWRNGADIVYGARIRRTHESWLMSGIRKIFYRALRSIGEVDIPVDAGDFRLIDRQALDAIKQLRENNRYVRGLCAWVGFRQVALPYERPERHAGESKYSILKLIKLGLSGIVGFSTAPLRLIFWIGMCVAGLSFAMSFFALGAWIFKPNVVEGWSSLVLFIGCISGIQLVGLGVMADYIARIHSEVKNRPIYVLRAMDGYDELPALAEKAVYHPRRPRPTSPRDAGPA